LPRRALRSGGRRYRSGIGEEITLTIILVTGGAGCIGSHATAGLLRRGRAVRVGGNFSTGSRVNLAAT